MTIVIDAFGGDNAPKSVLPGAYKAKKETDVNIILTGNRKLLEECARENGVDLSVFEIADCPRQISFSDSPEKVIDEGIGTSMGMGFSLLKNSAADAFLSAGNTGALFLGGAFYARRISGVTKAAIGTFVPTLKGQSFVLDSGANISCTPDDFVNFAKIGTAFLSGFCNRKNPQVFLLNNGTEENKGTALYRQSFEELKKNISINFCGNREGSAIPVDGADIVVCDGFCGNIFLKTYEGAAKMLLKSIKDIYNTDALTKLSALPVRKHFGAFASSMSSSSVGAAPILGLRKPVFKAHGSSDEKAFENAIKTVVKYVQMNVPEKISEALG